MRGKHTQREIGETLGRSRKSVELACRRIDDGESLGKQPTARVSDGIARRLGVADLSPPQVRNSAQTTKPRPVSPAALEPMLIVPDAHRPYHSKVWWNLLMQVGRALRPKHIIVIGDFADFYSVSSHDKDPTRANRLEDELADVDEGLNDLDSLGATRKIYVAGNHEDRMWRHLIVHSPSLAGIVTIEKLLNLRERNWEFVPYKHHIAIGAVHYTHDVGASGRNAVFRVLDTYQHSSCTGHAHRMQYIVEGNAVGEVKLSCMFGWGGDVTKVDYMNMAKARKDWALGFGIGYFDPRSGFSYLVPVPVVEGTVCVNGQLFRASDAA